MSADNFLGIYKVNSRKYIGRNCWSECERLGCRECNHVGIFEAKSLTEALKLAQDTIANGIYEYGYEFLNL